MLTSTSAWRRGSWCGDGAGADHEVRLGPVAVDVPHRGADQRHGARHRPRRAAARPIGPAGARERLEQPVVLDVPRRRHHDLLGVVGPLVQRPQLPTPQPRDRVPGAENRVAVRVGAPQRRVVQLEHEIVGGVLDHRRSPRGPPCARASDPRRGAPDGTRCRRSRPRQGRGACRARAPGRRCVRGRCRHRASRPRASSDRAISAALRRSVPLNTMCSSRWDTPISSGVSCTDADRTQAPNDDRPHSRHVLREYGQSVRQDGRAEGGVGAGRRAAHDRR